MSFATKGMTRGERSVPVPLAAKPAFPRSFSNAGVIDYRQGLNFANMLAGTQHDTFAASKQYNVNCDAEGHTVSMHIEPKIFLRLYCTRSSRCFCRPTRSPMSPRASRLK